MPESAVRAERFDSSTTPSPSYVWEVAGKPVAVQIGLELVDRLEHEVVENFRSLNSRGSEIGGVLLGSFQSGSPLRVSIQSYELIPCDYSRGPLYRFSEADVERFDRAVQQRNAASGQRVVGFFRSHTRKGLSLDAEDVAFFSGHFREPHQVALLIRPYASKPSSAGYFIWENGSVRGDASYLEFAFRRSVLERGPGSEAPAASNDMTAGPAPSPTPEPAVSKPTVRAQIVPIASRREITIPQAPPERVSAEPEKPPAAEPPPQATNEKAPSLHGVTVTDKTLATQRTPLPDRAALPPLPSQALPSQRTLAEKTAVSPAPKPAAPERTAAPEKVAPPAPKPAEEEPVPVVAKAPVDESEEQEKESPVSITGAFGRNKLMWVAGGSAVALLLLSGMLVYPGLGHKSQRPAGTSGSGSALALHVERSAGALLLTWNRDSEAVKNAARAELAINDGDQHENVNVDLSQLRNGSIVYTPSGADVVFQLSVTGRDSSKVASESLRVLRTRPSPMPDSTPAVTDKTAMATIRAAANTNVPAPPTPTVDAAPDNTDKKVSTAAPVLKPFTAEAPSQRLRPARPSDLPDAPGLPAKEQIAVVLPGTNLVPPAPVAAPQPPASSPTPKVGGQIKQAEVVSRTNPEYPMAARQARVQGAVVVSAMIGADGRVKSVKAISGPPLLQTAAAAAVKQWTYKPALLNGSPVESETRIELKFTMDH
jgi:periplasmic protein TonB